MTKSALLFTILTVVLSSGCGSFTKMRYSRGYKSNMEFHLKKRNGNEDEFKAAHAVKKQKVAKSTGVIKNKFGKEIGNFLFLSDPKFRKEKTKILNKKRILGVDLIRKVKPENTKNVQDKRFKIFRKPIEPHALKGSLLFYGAIALMILFFFLFESLTASLTIGNTILVLLFGILIGLVMMLTGLIHAITSFRYIRESGGAYSGTFLSISVILCSILLCIALVLL